MPVLDGIEATRRIHAATGETKVLVLTMHDEDALRVKALRAGAVGFLTKDCAMQEVVETVRRVADGRHGVLARDRRGDDGRVPGQRRRPRRTVTATSPSRSSHRSRSASARSCSSSPTVTRPPRSRATLFISAKTVKNHLASIYAKLDSRDRTQAVLSGMRLGIVQLQ